ncbi:acyloxyacyl hydrolase [Bacteroides sp. 519]|uniref:acyloxyacyl hydrolase n=1 Tax=Bacteroides sp. 519 TaxID=2302937 RepID=UPI0013D1510C|nr:acyloxyacyl hydrolase [Bacteroides sp. 519]NDV57358.1 acyloxyacyl hydrolase [Bacteroides sp. 519]
MGSAIKMWKILPLLVAMLFLSGVICAKGLIDSSPKNETDSVVSFPSARSFLHSSICVADHFRFESNYLHQLSFETRPEYIIPTIEFLEGHNYDKKPIRNAFSAHLKYSFKALPNSISDRVYKGAYQGIGISYFSFGERQQIGNPIGVYLFQGARIARLGSRVSLNYEWNFGLSFRWKPYDYYENYYNTVIGSKVNAYMNVNFYFKWMLSKYFDFIGGVTLTHFSNGNTKYPNAGLNTTGAKIGFVYNFNRHKDVLAQTHYPASIPEFMRHISYDLALFGAWRRKGIVIDNEYVASPHAYPVAGFCFAPMYNFGYRFRAGVSLDGFYDGSANIYNQDYTNSGKPDFVTPPIRFQTALGLSVRGEYVMPYFSVNVGLGANVLHNGGDLRGLYQILALKVGITRNSYLHIGYSLKDFHLPNFLMLGVGFRFNNKYPALRR